MPARYTARVPGFRLRFVRPDGRSDQRVRMRGSALPATMVALKYPGTTPLARR